MFSVRLKALAITEALGGFGVEGFGSDPAVASAGCINPGAIGWHIRLSGSVPVGMGPFETGKVQAGWFSALFLYCSSLVWNLISITRRSSSFALLTGTSAATLLRPLSTALANKGKYGRYRKNSRSLESY